MNEKVDVIFIWTDKKKALWSPLREEVKYSKEVVKYLGLTLRERLN